jgi:hypothetical protein
MSAPQPEKDSPVKCVHLEPGPRGFGSDEGRRAWHARGYATLPEYEGHPLGVRCGTCSTDEPKAKP